VNIKHYHADNGRFKGKLFSKSIEEKGQTISFCGIGAHHQKWYSRKKNRRLTKESHYTPTTCSKRMARCN